MQWWEEVRGHYELFTSQLVINEASEGRPEATKCRYDSLRDKKKLVVDEEMETLAETKLIVRSICAVASYTCPEIGTPQELLPEEPNEISG